MTTSPRRTSLRIDGLWQGLSATGQRPASRRVDEHHPCDLYAVVDATGERVLMLVTSDEPPVPPQYESVTVNRAQRQDGRWNLLLKLSRHGLDAPFVALCDDLVESSRRAPAGTKAADFILDRLARWRKLMEVSAAGLLSDEALRGLVGELLFLEQAALPRWGAEASVRGWEGPFEAPQDFLLPDLNVEVKTARPGTSTVRISSVEQLDVDAPLALTVVVLGPGGKDSGGFTPAELVARLRGAMTADVQVLSDFEARLAAAGYADREEYERVFFRMHTMRYFGVAADFPRLRRALLPAGVGAATYELNLAACAAFEIGTLGNGDGTG